MAIYTTFWFDVEDYISPRADDALSMLLDVFERNGLRATWKLVGEKLRVLEHRGRRDIIEKLSRQDLGYHTDYHSLHPTVAEYCEGLGWLEGQREFELREGPGFDDMKRVFGRTPSTYGQPGAGWVPHAYPILAKWGIPTYIDETSQIGLNHQPFIYCGIINVLNLGPNTHRVDITGGPDAVDSALRRFSEAKARLERAGGGLLQVFYHPCEYSCDEFWDGANFARGANPLHREQWRLPAQATDADMAGRVSIFESFLKGIVATGVKIVCASEIAALFADKAPGRKLSKEQLMKISDQLMNGDLAPVYLDGYFLSPAECFWALVQYLTMGSAVTATAILGPAVRTRTRSNVGELSTDLFLDACKWAYLAVSNLGSIPSSLFAGSTRLSPADFLATAAGLASERLKGGDDPKDVPLHEGNLTLEDNITGKDAWGWTIFPPGFDAPRVIEQGKLQAWTLKPAVIGQCL